MPTTRDVRTALAAGTTVQNILQGSIYEQMQRMTRVTIAAVSSVVDTQEGVQFGSRTMALQSEMSIPVEPAANVGPNIPDQVIVDDIALPLERIVISINVVTGPANVRTLVNFTEVG